MNKINTILAGAVGLTAMAAVTIPTQRPTLAERVSTINNQINARQAMPSTDRGMLVVRQDSDGNVQVQSVDPPQVRPNKPTPSTGPAAAIIGLDTYYKPMTNFQGGFYYAEAGKILSYHTVSSNAPNALVDGMNGADAVAVLWGAGLTNLIFSNYGLFIMTR